MLGIAARPALDQIELDDLPPIVTPAFGNVDAAYVVTRGRAVRFPPDTPVRPGATIRIVGWCADPQARAAGAKLLLIVDGTKRIDVSSDYGAARPDVAAVFAAPAMRDTGFAIDVRADAFGPGAHDLHVAVVTADERAISEFPTAITFSEGGG
jgi:hypothetical protein